MLLRQTLLLLQQGMAGFVGRTLEQESGNGWAENLHPEDFGRCLQICVSNFDARRPFEMEYRMLHHTGQYRWILDRGMPPTKRTGRLRGMLEDVSIFTPKKRRRKRFGSPTRQYA